MIKPATFVTAREALALFMTGHEPPLDDAAMGKLVEVTRTGVTKWRNGDRTPTLEIAARLEAVTGIPASAWSPASDEQGRVSPAWLKLKPAQPVKAARKRSAVPA